MNVLVDGGGQQFAYPPKRDKVTTSQSTLFIRQRIIVEIVAGCVCSSFTITSQSIQRPLDAPSLNQNHHPNTLSPIHILPRAVTGKNPPNQLGAPTTELTHFLSFYSSYIGQTASNRPDMPSQTPPPPPSLSLPTALEPAPSSSVDHARGGVGEVAIESSDLVRLVLAFLTAQGLHESARVLRRESGVGFRPGGMVQRGAVARSIRLGDWGPVLKATGLLQRGEAGRGGDIDAAAIPTRIAEQVILELAEEDRNLDLAYSLLQVQRDGLDQVVESDDEGEEEADDSNKEDDRGKKRSKSSDASTKISKARSLEQRLASIAANPIKFANVKARQDVLYGTRNTKKSRREVLARMVESQRDIPLNRLPTLIQQAMKWQSHTGQLPWIKEMINDDDEQEGSTGPDESDKGRREKKKRKRKFYDLVFGEVSGDKNLVVGDHPSVHRGGLHGHDDDQEYKDALPAGILAKVKFGKSAVCESALFFERGLITGSSDSLIEVWDSVSSYNDLNTTDYPYQKDHVMGHDDASILCMGLSNDGEILVSGDSKGRVKIWKLATGKCLRQYQAHDAAVTTLSLSRDASRLLTGSSSGICREFGVVSQNVLQVYEGHTSYIYTCRFVVDWKMDEDRNPLAASAELWVVTSSADGTVRLWQNGLSIRILQPTPNVNSPIGGKHYSMVVDPTEIQTDRPAIHNVLPIPGEESRMLVVSRSSVAYLVDVDGNVLQLYVAESPDTIFVAATVTSTVAYLATAQGDCLVFSIAKGKLIYTVREFALDSTSKTNTDRRLAEVSALLHHPFKPSILAAFSNDKSQKKGVLTVWK
jgi:LisH-like dimerisation domain/Anaphase-promoting complex subunit 4 WD40 domain/WD domain, G-beta repeat